MNEIVLEAEQRPISTKGVIKAMRRKGKIPGVAYGNHEAPATLSIDEKSVQAILRSKGGRNALIQLKLGGGAHPVLIKEIQRHPITRALWHVDFQRISLKKEVETKVPVRIRGESPGVKMGGGVLEHLVREVRVRCLPTEIPEYIDVDVSNLQLNQGIRAKELVLPKGVEILMDAESVIVHVLFVHVEEAPAPAAAEAAVGAAEAEPEVIKKGKVEEGEEGEAGAKTTAAAEKKAPAPAATPPKPEAKKPEGK